VYRVLVGFAASADRADAAGSEFLVVGCVVGLAVGPVVPGLGGRGLRRRSAGRPFETGITQPYYDMQS